MSAWQPVQPRVQPQTEAASKPFVATYMSGPQPGRSQKHPHSSDDSEGDRLPTRPRAGIGSQRTMLSTFGEISDGESHGASAQWLPLGVAGGKANTLPPAGVVVPTSMSPLMSPFLDAALESHGSLVGSSFVDSKAGSFVVFDNDVHSPR